MYIPGIIILLIEGSKQVFLLATPVIHSHGIFPFFIFSLPEGILPLGCHPVMYYQFDTHKELGSTQSV